MALKWFKKNRKKHEKTEPAVDGEQQELEPTDRLQTRQPENCDENPPLNAATQPVEEPIENPAQDLSADSAHDAAEKPQKAGYFKRLKNRLSKTRKSFSGGMDNIFAGRIKIDDELLDELEELLITSDLGVQTSIELIERISRAKIKDVGQLKTVLKNEILAILNSHPAAPQENYHTPHVILVVGVNGVGKTTTIGKIAASLRASGKKVLIAAADTFRAAAVEQLGIWAARADAEFVRHKDKADPAAVAFDAVAAALARGCDAVLIDTAGRLHTKINLMEELKKIKRTVAKQIDGAPHEILMVLDATTGQNALSQVKLFNDAIGITGLALTKLDGTAKGGIVIGICSSLNVPLKYIGIGEQIEDLRPFDAEQYIEALFEDDIP